MCTCTRLHEFPSRARKSQLRHLYRSQQILHAVFSEILQHILPTAIPVGESLLITSIYTVVRQFHSNHPLVLFIIGSVGLVAFIYLKEIIEMGGNLLKASEQYAKLSSMESTLPHVKFSRHERKFFQSCPPLKVRVADSFILRQEAYIRILNEVIVSSVINLLVIF